MAEIDRDPENIGVDGLLGKGKWTRYDNMVKILRNMAKDLIGFDKNHSIPCYFFNSNVTRVDITDHNLLVAQVKKLQPGGSTALHLALQQAVNDQLNDNENFLFIVFTDGIPDNGQAVDQIIHNNIHILSFILPFTY